MSAPSPRSYLVDALASDGYDGLVRLLVDAQRFGLELDEVRLIVLDDASVSIRLTLFSVSDLDCAAIEARLSRHPTIGQVEATRIGTDKTRSYPAVQQQPRLEGGGQ